MNLIKKYSGNLSYNYIKTFGKKEKSSKEELELIDRDTDTEVISDIISRKLLTSIKEQLSV